MLAGRLDRVRSNAIRDILKVTEQPGVISLAGGLPAPEAFPVAELEAAALRLFRTDPGPALQYSPTDGLAPLREWVAARLTATHGGSFRPEHVLITHGSQQALDLVAKVLLDPGDIVAVDDPSYLGAIQVFDLFEARFLTVPADREGTDVDVLAARLAAGARPKLLYTVANFQNPTGATLPLDRRRRLAGLAEEYGFLIVEDDPYGELRYRGTPVPAIATLSERVIRLGTFSKILVPGLRVAYMTIPAALYPAFIKVKQAADLHTSTFAQRLVLETVSEAATLDAHIARLCEVYGERNAAVLAALDDHFAGLVDWNRPEGGMFVWARMREGGPSAHTLWKAAIAHQVAFVPGAPFYAMDGDAATFRLSFVTVAPDRLAEAVGRLRAAYDEVA